MNEILARTVEGLKRRGFEAVGVSTKAEALKLVMTRRRRPNRRLGGTSREGDRRRTRLSRRQGDRDQSDVDGSLPPERERNHLDASSSTSTAWATALRRPSTDRSARLRIGRNKVVNRRLLERSPREALRVSAELPPTEQEDAVRRSRCLPDCDSPDDLQVTAFFDRGPTRTPTKVILVERFGL